MKSTWILLPLLLLPGGCASTPVRTFATPEQAVQARIVYERDLGTATAGEVANITTFAPDATWEPVAQ